MAELFNIDMSDTSTEQAESVNIAFAYTDAQGKTQFISAEEAEQMGITTEGQQSQNNPFAGLAGATNAGRHSDNNAELEQQEETTGDLQQEAEGKTDKVEESYNGEEGANPGNTETGTTTVVSSSFPNVTRSGVPHQHYLYAGLAAAVFLTAMGIITKKVLKSGAQPFTRERRRETKLNAQSKKYFAVRAQYKAQEKFMTSKETKEDNIAKETKEDNIAKDLKKVQEKISKGKLTRKQNIRLVKRYSNGSKAKRYYENNIVDPTYNKDALKAHRTVIKNEAKIAGSKSSKRINKLKTKQTEAMNNIPLGSLPGSIHYASRLPNMYNNMSAKSDMSDIPLYIHRAVSNIESLNKVLDKAHKVLPFADKKIRICKIDLYKADGTVLKTISGSFDNEIGYKVVKAALINEVKALKKENSEITEVVVKESVQGSKTEQTTTTYDVNVDNSENKISDFNEQLDNAASTLKKFNSLYTKTRNSDLSM